MLYFLAHLRKKIGGRFLSVLGIWQRAKSDDQIEAIERSLQVDRRSVRFGRSVAARLIQWQLPVNDRTTAGAAAAVQE